MSIEFERVERDCPHNDDIKTGINTGKLLEDYHVIDDGEHTATFIQKDEGSHKHNLSDLSFKYIRSEGETGYILTAKCKSGFEGLYLRSKAKGFVPTAEQIAERKVIEEAHHLKEECRNRKIENAEESYDLVKNLTKICQEAGYVPPVIDQALRLIDRVEL